MKSARPFWLVLASVLSAELALSNSANGQDIHYDDDTDLDFVWAPAAGQFAYYNVHVSVDGGDYQLYGMSFTAQYTVVAQDGHSYRTIVSTVTFDGVEGPSSPESDPVVCDTEAPLPPVISQTYDVLDQNTVVLTVERGATDANFSNYQVFGGQYIQWTDTSETSAFVFTVEPDSNNVLRVRGKDLAGNVGPAASITYGGDSPAPNCCADNATEGARYLTIQEALFDCSDGDEIIVHPGVYAENIDFGGKNVVLRTTDPSDPYIVSNTVIDGSRSGPVVTFSGAEDETCILSGFTIRNGKALDGGGICGGTEKRHTHATIQNNVVTENTADRWGGGLVFCGGDIQNNTVCDNSARYGGGLSDCHGNIQNNVVYGNFAEEGGGLDWCHGTIRNCTICDNLATANGGGLIRCRGEIINCIIWGNAASDGAQVCDSVVPSFSCIQHWEGGGEGNISEDPRFIGSDYRLSPDSPCIDKGYNASLGPPGLDKDGLLRIVFGQQSLSVDIGAYECDSRKLMVTQLKLAAGSGCQLTWTSQPNDSYTVWSCSDLLSGRWSEETSVQSQGESTTWTDPDAASTRKFYRIEMR